MDENTSSAGYVAPRGGREVARSRCDLCQNVVVRFFTARGRPMWWTATPGRGRRPVVIKRWFSAPRYDPGRGGPVPPSGVIEAECPDGHATRTSIAELHAALSAGRRDFRASAGPTV